MTICDKIENLGLTLPPAPPPGGVYRPIVIMDKWVFVSGHGPVRNDGTLITGKVGTDLDLEEGKMAARQVGLTMLSTLKEQLDNLDHIKRIVKVFGMVNCMSDFHDQPYVINGFSELMRDLWGEDYGLAARSAVGMTLPGNIAVEVEAIFELNS